MGARAIYRRAIMRTGTVHRATAETSIDVRVDLDGTGAYTVATGIGFLDQRIPRQQRLAGHRVGLQDIENDARTGIIARRQRTRRPERSSRSRSACGL